MFKSEQSRLPNLSRLGMLGDPITAKSPPTVPACRGAGTVFSGRSAWSQREKLSGYGDSKVVQLDEGIRVHPTGFGRQRRLCSYLGG